MTHRHRWIGSFVLALAVLAGGVPTAAQEGRVDPVPAIRAERRIRMQEVLNTMDPVDREILALRHYEQLSNSEVAEVLDMDKSATSKRYARALFRLKEILASLPGGLGEI